MEMVTGTARYRPDTLTTRQHANVAATVDEEQLQENMSWNHLNRYEIPDTSLPPESILTSCFVVPQQEQANLQHRDREISIQNEMASQEASSSTRLSDYSINEDEEIRQSWALSNFAFFLPN